METINDLVGYDNLKIYQNDDWFKFSLESVLLPNFVSINPSTKSILDLCTGNAPIPLILSTRTNAHIIGVEIQKDIYDLACKTIKINHLENQIEIINDDILNIKDKYESDSFDIITVNPPYFKTSEESIKNQDLHKTIARHEYKITLEDIVKISRKLLKNNARLAMVHRTERFFEIIKVLEQNNLTPKKIQFIHPKANTPSNLFMVEAVKNGKDGATFLSPLYIHNEDGGYRDEILEIFKRNKTQG